MKTTKILCLLIIILYCNINGTYTFTFTSQKDDRWGRFVGALRHDFLKQIKDVVNADVFVETGTYSGATTTVAATIFKEVHTIELSHSHYEQAKRNLAQYRNVFAHFGSSPDVFNRILPKIEGKIIFWLDAHYCGSGTALNADNKSNPQAFTPIKKELQAICDSNIKNCVILIDDIRGFGSRINDQCFMNWLGYPTIQEICNLLRSINNNFEIVLIGDILLAYDKAQSNVTISPVVDACTKSRFYDGITLTDDDLLSIEDTIAHAQGAERIFIEYLNNIPSEEKSKGLFNYLLWEALIDYQNGNFSKAYESFRSILAPKKHFDEQFRYNNSAFCYGHWRIYWYLAQTCLKLNRAEEAGLALRHVRENVSDELFSDLSKQTGITV